MSQQCSAATLKGLWARCPSWWDAGPQPGSQPAMVEGERVLQAPAGNHSRLPLFARMLWSTMAVLDRVGKGRASESKNEALRAKLASARGG